MILMILIPSPYPFFKNVIFAHESLHEFMCKFAREFVKEFFMNFVHEFEYEIRTNSYELFARKIGYVTNDLYYTIKLLLTKTSIHTGNICSAFKAHGRHCVRSICLECQNKYFLIWSSSSVNKSIIFSVRAKYTNCARVFLHGFPARETRQHNSRISLYVLCE